MVYRLPSDHSLGSVQLLASPWDDDQAMLVVTGSTDESVAWAMDALTDGTLSGSLTGDLVTIVREGEFQVIDTGGPRAGEETELSYSELVAAMTAEGTVTPTPAAHTSAAITSTVSADKPVVITNSRPAWFIPVLSISVLTVIVSVGLYVWQNRRSRL